MLVQNNSSCCMLDTLKKSCVLKRSAIQNKVQLIKARRNVLMRQRQPYYHLTMDEFA